MLRFLRHIFIATSCMVAFSQGLPSQLNLGGFQLGQLISTAENKFGKPFEVRTTADDWLVNAFWISEKKEHMLIFECQGPGKKRISSIQIFGKPSPCKVNLGGITLGTPETEVIKVLGEPTNRKTYEDEGSQYTTLEFEGKNYSIELNKNSVVASIKIIGYEGFPNKPDKLPTTEPLRKALKNGDMSAFESLLAPDFEIYRGKNIISYNGPSTEDINSNSALREALLGKNGLKVALDGDKSEEDPQIRIATKAVYHVVKFPKNPILQEIVYTLHAGSWRIYEILFKN